MSQREAASVQRPFVSAPELSEVVQTASVSSLRDSSATELLQEITLHNGRPRIAPVVIVLAAVGVAFGMLFHLPPWGELGLVLGGALAHAFAAQADYKRKVVRLDYAMEPEATRAFLALLTGIEQLRTLRGLWRITSGEVNKDTKYHAGAQYSIVRNRIEAKFECPKFISADVAIVRLSMGEQRLYFFPDRILIYEGDQIGAVSYGSLTLTVEPSAFVEDEGVPSDAEIISKTWRYTNKSGGPDHRFTDNPQIPVVRYARVAIQSSAGLNYLLQASNMQKANSFAQAIREYGGHLTATGQAV